MDVCPRRAGHGRQTRVRLDRVVLLEQRETLRVLPFHNTDSYGVRPMVMAFQIAHCHVAHHFFVTIPFCECLPSSAVLARR